MAWEEKCFTFTWELENVSFCLEKKNTEIRSPDFVVDSIDESKWCLYLYPRGITEYEEYVAFYLNRHSEAKGDAKLSVKYELSLIKQDNYISTYFCTDKFDFPNNCGHGSPNLAKREDIFITKRSASLTKDALTASCRIWKSVGEMTENVECLARTRIGVEKRTLLWNIANFSTLEYRKKYTKEIKSLAHDKQLITINLSLVGGLSSEEIISFELLLQDPAIKFSTLLLSLVDVSGNRIECNRYEFWFDETRSKEFKFFFTKNKLMAMKSSYLPNGNLSLHWEWAFSKGIVSQEIEKVQYVSSEDKFYNAQNMNNKNMALSYAFNDNLKSLYDKNFLCDVHLKTSTGTFNAHKVILSASSSVFEAMFSSDMKEKRSNCVNIEDLSDDTIRRMLAYIYTARIEEDLTWERASRLYAAADKYAIFSLKNICSSYFTCNLSPRNACEALLLSDFHADEDLQYSVQNYVLKHLKDTVKSDGWKLLMKTNPTLAAETLSLPHNEI